MILGPALQLKDIKRRTATGEKTPLHVCAGIVLYTFPVNFISNIELSRVFQIVYFQHVVSSFLKLLVQSI